MRIATTIERTAAAKIALGSARRASARPRKSPVRISAETTAATELGARGMTSPSAGFETERASQRDVFDQRHAVLGGERANARARAPSARTRIAGTGRARRRVIERDRDVRRVHDDERRLARALRCAPRTNVAVQRACAATRACGSPSCSLASRRARIKRHLEAHAASARRTMRVIGQREERPGPAAARRPAASRSRAGPAPPSPSDSVRRRATAQHVAYGRRDDQAITARTRRRARSTDRRLRAPNVRVAAGERRERSNSIVSGARRESAACSSAAATAPARRSTRAGAAAASSSDERARLAASPPRRSRRTALAACRREQRQRGGQREESAANDATLGRISCGARRCPRASPARAARASASKRLSALSALTVRLRSVRAAGVPASGASNGMPISVTTTTAAKTTGNASEKLPAAARRARAQPARPARSTRAAIAGAAIGTAARTNARASASANVCQAVPVEVAPRRNTLETRGERRRPARTVEQEEAGRETPTTKAARTPAPTSRSRSARSRARRRSRLTGRRRTPRRRAATRRSRSPLPKTTSRASAATNGKPDAPKRRRAQGAIASARSSARPARNGGGTLGCEKPGARNAKPAQRARTKSVVAVTARRRMRESRVPRRRRGRRRHASRCFPERQPRNLRQAIRKQRERLLSNLRCRVYHCNDRADRSR